METFEFGGYTLRPACLADLRLAKEWTAADPDHAGKVDPGFWLGQSARAQSYLLIDSEGPVFFFKGIIADRSLEIHVQFPPRACEALHHRQRQRISQGLMEGLAWLEMRVSGVIEEIIFESTTPALIRFCERRLGFAHASGKLRKQLKQLVTAGE